MNLEKRAKWHFELNQGYVPFLELPTGEILTESLLILEYIESSAPQVHKLYFKEDPHLYAR